MQSIPLTAALKRGIVLIESNELDRARDHFQQLLAQHPDQADVLNLTGVVLLLGKEHEEAAKLLGRAAELRPNVAEYHANYAAALKELRRWTDAEHTARRAVQLNPKLLKAWRFLATALSKQLRFEEAIAAYEKVLAANPTDADAHSGLGVCYFDRGEYEPAMAEQREALRLRPEFPVARLNLGLIQLLLGQEHQGWENYEARRQCEDRPKHNFQQPMWDGQPLNGRTILLYTEQGLGDAIQFVRFIPQVAALGGQVILACQPELAELLSTVAGLHSVCNRDEALPDFNVYAPLLSLPQILCLRMAAMRAKVPYLAPDAKKVDWWRRRLEGDRPGRRVGLVWGGGASHRRDAHRSIPLSLFAPLISLQGMRFYSLQKGPRTAELHALLPNLDLVDHTAELHTMADTAAMIENLDLVISADTSVCHVAGALGKPVWTLIAAVPHWGWGLEGESTPWYPTMRLFRQKTARDWEGVIDRVIMALREKISRPLPNHG